MTVKRHPTVTVPDSTDAAESRVQAIRSGSASVPVCGRLPGRCGAL